MAGDADSQPTPYMAGDTDNQPTFLIWQVMQTVNPLLIWQDHWHSPPQSGEPPSKRAGMAFTTVGSDMYLFGGEDGDFSGSGFTQDLHVLHTDTMSRRYGMGHVMGVLLHGSRDKCICGWPLAQHSFVSDTK